jgi:peptidoglycan/xylan/chitin deacetylase (PgdA/CDA1 family)
MLRPVGGLLLRRPRAAMRLLGLAAATLVEAAARRTGRQVGLALMYHRVDPVQGDPAREIVPPIGAALFEAQMRHLARRYDVVTASALPAAVSARRRGQRFPVAVTFDDDDPSHVPVTLPILARTGTVATFFLNCASLEEPTRFWWEHLQELWDRGEDPCAEIGLSPAAPPGDPRRLHEVAETVQELPPERRREVAARLAALAGADTVGQTMGADEIREVRRAGHELGWHTLRHEPLTTLDDDALAAALREGRERLSGLAGAEPAAIAYPHGKVDERVARAAGAAGLAAGYTTYAEGVVPSDDPLRLGRLLPSFDSPGHFALQLARRLVRPRA